MTYFTNFIYSTICRIDHKVDWSSGETFVLAPSTQTEDPPNCNQLEEEESPIRAERITVGTVIQLLVAGKVSIVAFTFTQNQSCSWIAPTTGACHLLTTSTMKIVATLQRSCHIHLFPLTCHCLL